MAPPICSEHLRRNAYKELDMNIRISDNGQAWGWTPDAVEYAVEVALSENLDPAQAAVSYLRTELHSCHPSNYDVDWEDGNELPEVDVTIVVTDEDGNEWVNTSTYEVGGQY